MDATYTGLAGGPQRLGSLSPSSRSSGDQRSWGLGEQTEEDIGDRQTQGRRQQEGLEGGRGGSHPALPPSGTKGAGPGTQKDLGVSRAQGTRGLNQPGPGQLWETHMGRWAPLTPDIVPQGTPKCQILGLPVLCQTQA